MDIDDYVKVVNRICTRCGAMDGRLWVVAAPCHGCGASMAHTVDVPRDGSFALLSWEDDDE